MVYPGEERATAKLTPGGTICSDVKATSCIATISRDDNYTVSLTIRNDVGSSVPVINSFDCKYCHCLCRAMSNSLSKIFLSQPMHYWWRRWTVLQWW